MITFTNVSQKIINVNGIAVMPDSKTDLPDSYADLPSIKAMADAGRVRIERKATISAKRNEPSKPIELPEEEKEEAAADEPAVEETKEQDTKPAAKKRSTKKKTEDPADVEAELAKKIFG